MATQLEIRFVHPYVNNKFLFEVWVKNLSKEPVTLCKSVSECLVLQLADKGAADKGEEAFKEWLQPRKEKELRRDDFVQLGEREVKLMDLHSTKIEFGQDDLRIIHLSSGHQLQVKGLQSSLRFSYKPSPKAIAFAKEEGFSRIVDQTMTQSAFTYDDFFVPNASEIIPNFLAYYDFPIAFIDSKNLEHLKAFSNALKSVHYENYESSKTERESQKDFVHRERAIQGLEHIGNSAAAEILIEYAGREPNSQLKAQAIGAMEKTDWIVHRAEVERLLEHHWQKYKDAFNQLTSQFLHLIAQDPHSLAFLRNFEQKANLHEADALKEYPQYSVYLNLNLELLKNGDQAARAKIISLASKIKDVGKLVEVLSLYKNANDVGLIKSLQNFFDDRRKDPRMSHDIHYRWPDDPKEQEELRKKIAQQEEAASQRVCDTALKIAMEFLQDRNLNWGFSAQSSHQDRFENKKFSKEEFEKARAVLNSLQDSGINKEGSKMKRQSQYEKLIDGTEGVYEFITPKDHFKLRIEVQSDAVNLRLEAPGREASEVYFSRQKNSADRWDVSLTKGIRLNIKGYHDGASYDGANIRLDLSIEFSDDWNQATFISAKLESQSAGKPRPDKAYQGPNEWVTDLEFSGH